MNWYMLAVKIGGALELTSALVLASAGQAACLINLMAFVCLCALVYRTEGWRGRFFADIAVYEINLEDLQERIDHVPAQID